jgi:hypothetical protein
MDPVPLLGADHRTQRHDPGVRVADVDPLVQVGVGEHDHRVVAAQFEVGAGEVTCGELANGPAGLGGAGEGRGLDVGMRDHR